MPVLNESTIEAYFSHLVSALKPSKTVNVIVVAHMVPNTLHFLPAVGRMANLAAVLPKPKSVARPEYTEISTLYATAPLSREWSSNGAAVFKAINDLGIGAQKTILVDIGGYFAQSADDIADRMSGNLVGILEGTENGVQKYERKMPYKVPLITVARSPLKLPEDYLVASSVVFSIEAALRDQAEILQTRSAAVLGYGRVGSAVAEILRGRGINTVVFDNDPVRLAEAAAKGFRAHLRLEDALATSTLVVCATGNKSLNLRGFAMLRSGSVVASVTSADDELDLASLKRGYRRMDLPGNITRFDENRAGGRHFLLVAGGDAANFLHGAVIGPAIQLIEGEKLAAIKTLVDGNLIPTLSPHEVSKDQRRKVAEIWNEHFLH